MHLHISHTNAHTLTVTDTPGLTSTCVILPWNQTRTLTIVTLRCQEFARGPALRDVSRHRAYTYRDTYQIRRPHTYTPAHIHVHTCAHTRTHLRTYKYKRTLTVCVLGQCTRLRTYTYTPTHIHVQTDTDSVCFGPMYTPTHIHVHTYAHTRTNRH